MKKRFLAIPLFALGLSACGETSALRAQLETEVTKPDAPNRYLSDRREAFQSLTILASDPIELRRVTSLSRQPLPEKSVGPLDFKNVDVAFALRALAWEAGVAVQFERGVGAETVSLATSRPIGFEEAVGIILTNAGLDYSYDGRVMTVRQGGLYTMAVPGTDRALDGIRTVVEAMGGEIVTTDAASSRMTIRADQKTADQIQAFMRNAGTSSDLIIFDAWLYEVALTDRESLGIDWEAGVSGLLSGALDISFKTPGSAGEGFVGTIGLEKGDFDLSSFVSFLNAQGAVRSVSSPTLSMKSGDAASFNISQNQIFVRNLRQVQNTSSESSTNPTVETETDEIVTGIDVSTKATFASGIVFADFDMVVSEFLRFEEFPSGDTTLKLPVTTKRQLKTSVQARPGDVIVMGGMISERQSTNDTGLARTSIVTRASGESQRSELVVLLRPRVVSFRPGR